MVQKKILAYKIKIQITIPNNKILIYNMTKLTFKKEQQMSCHSNILKQRGICGMKSCMIHISIMQTDALLLSVAH